MPIWFTLEAKVTLSSSLVFKAAWIAIFLVVRSNSKAEPISVYAVA
jgi:hypothetical protein